METTAVMNKGIDVSRHNGDIDWAKVKADGVKFVMIRAGYGANNIDDKFVRNIKECNRLGIPCGVYWFSYAYTTEMAKKEAQYCLKAVKPYKLEYPIAFDLEYDTVDYAAKQGVTITKQLATELVKAFCGEIEKAEYFAVNYANPDYLKRYFDDSLMQKYGLWLAAWNDYKYDEPPYKCYMWQYSSKGTVKGISGSVDMNRGYVDFPKIIREAGLNGLKKESEKKWYSDAWDWGIENGLTDGKNPEEPATRAQVIVMLKRFRDKFI